MPAASDGNDAVNMEELKEIMDDDMELIQDCFAEFIQDWPELYVEIKAAALEKDAEKLDTSAHKLKGTLRYLAAEPAAKAAQALENAGKENQMENIGTMLFDLKKEGDRLMDFINRFNP